MSPLVIVGQLIFLVYLVRGDVSHLLRGNHPPNGNAQAVNSLVIAHDGKQSASGEFWWQNGDSPLKTAYDQFKNCQNNNNGVGACSLQHHENVVKFNSELASESFRVDLSKNPFFNGNVTGNAGTQKLARPDLSKNPFFSGHGQVIEDNGEGFLGVQPAEIKFAKPKPFSLTHPLSGDCSGSSVICVPVNKCGKDGFTTANLDQDTIANKPLKCNQKTEICCRIRGRDFSEISAGKSSILSVKKSSIYQVLPNGDELRPDIHSAGESGAGFNIISTTAKPIRDVTFNPIFSSTVDYSNTVFGDARFGSTIKGPDYLPPYENTPPPTTKPPYIPPPPPPEPSCPIGQRYINGRCQCIAPNTRLQNGICVPITTPPPPPPPSPSCPSDQRFINGICQCIAPNTYLENGRCIPRRPPPPPPPPVPTCPYDQRLVNGICQCKAANTRLENGNCVPIRPPPTPPPIVCSFNEQLVNGRCVPRVTTGYLPPETVTTRPCPPGQQLINGICQCTQPNTRLQNGVCVTITTPRPPPPPPPTPSCPPGQQLIGGRCQCATPNTRYENGRCVPIITCSFNEQLINGRCVPRQTPPPPPPTTCSFGEQLVNGRCISVTTGYTYSTPKITFPPPPPTPAPCPSDQRYINGRCQCIASDTRLENGRCVAIVTCGFNERLVNGRCVPIPTTAPPPPPSPSCPSDQRFINGRCECIAANARLENGRCIAIVTCGFNERLVNGRCVPIPTPPPPTTRLTCSFGEQLVNGRCIPTTTGYTYTTPSIPFPPSPPPRPTCPNDQRYINGRCECIAANTRLENGRCIAIVTCGFNERLVNGRCVPIPTPPPPPPPRPSCPNDQRFVNGRCECIAANTRLENGRCIAIITCGFNERLVNGRCVPIPTPPPTTGYTYTTPRIPFTPSPPPSCPSDQRYVNGRCECIAANTRLENGRCIPIITCGFNERLVNGRCVPIPTPPPPTTRITCSFGEQFVNGRCIPVTTGYTYTTPRIPFTPSAPPPPPRCPSDQRYVNGRCECIAANTHLENGRCVPIVTCGFNERLVNGRCVPIPTPPSPPTRVTCSFGEQLINGRCITVTTGYTYTTPRIPFTPSPPPSCPSDQRYVNGRCECIAANTRLENGRCIAIITCGFNERLVNGRCVPVPTPPPPPPSPSCPSDQRFINGRCECITANTRLENGRCVPIITCGFNERLVNGRCVPIATPPPPTTRITCSFGEQLINGRCIPVTTGYTYTTPRIPFTPSPPPKPSCPSDQRYINGRCECIAANTRLENGRCIAIITCGFNERLVNGRCVPIPTPPPPTTRITCSFGEQLVNGRCIPVTTGYTYTTPRIPFTPSPPPPPPRCPSDQRYVNGRCECIAANTRLENGRCIAIITCGFNERLVNGRCVPIPTPPPPPPPSRVTCSFGEQLVNGRCIPITTGYTYTTPSIPFTPSPPPRPSCPSDQRFINGRCECIAANTRLENGRCIAIITCGFNERLVNGRCVPIPTPPPPPTRVTCSFGEELVNGRCIPVTTGYTYTTPKITFPPPPPSCPSDQRYINGRCECIAPNTRLENGRCIAIVTCGPNERLVNGRCVPIPPPPPPPPSCPGDQRYVNGRCECIAANTRLENGRCIAIITCGFNERLVNGRCVPIPTPPPPPPPSRVTCAFGEQLVNGRCIAITTGYTYTTPRIPFTPSPPPPPPPPRCPSDQRYINGRCECIAANTRLENGRCIPIVTCGPNERLVNGRCIPPPPPPPPSRVTCSFGEQLVNGRCIPITTGYTYTTPSVPFPPVTPPSCGAGQRYVNGRCECISANTILQNGVCVPRPTPPPSCPPNTYLLNGRCIPSQPKGPEGYIYDKPDKKFDSSNTISVNVRPSEPTTPPNTYIPVTTESSGSTFKNNYITPETTPRPRPELIPEGNVNINVVERLTTPGPQFVSGCAAALKCVQEIYCTPEGFISPVPVVLNKEQLDNRVPLANCTILDTASEGKCCRDPNYKDPWPSANLINGVDDGQYKEDNTLGQYFPDKQRSVRSGVLPTQRKKAETESVCGVRNYNTQPKANVPPEVNFAEIPWQAMILRDSSRTLLCGGAIISPNVVLTTAHCIDGIESRDILVKGGEWKLGVDEEPQPFQIVKVAAVARHPNYKPGDLTNDLAVLLLSEKLRLTGNVGTLCLSQQQPQLNKDKCIVTGWGKKILQVHLKNALMHSIDAQIIDENQCRNDLTTRYQEFVPSLGPSTICARSKLDQCKVDYGSAMACEDTNGQYHLVGIFSWDTGCKDGNQIGGYIRPDHDWIQKTIRTPARQLRKLERDFLAAGSS